MAKRQPHLPDESFAPPVGIAEIEAAAEEYAGYRDERQAALEQEIECKKRLVTLMEFHNLTEYNRDGIEIRFETEKKLKVKIKSHDSDDEGDSGEEE